MWAKALSDLGGFFACLKMKFVEVRYRKMCIYSYLVRELQSLNELPVHEYK